MEKNENGFSAYNFGSSNRNRNNGCAGAGEQWTPNGNGNANGSVGGATDSGNHGTSCHGDELGGSRQLAMVYSPYQCWRMLYSPEKALMRGTLFEELDKPLEDCVNG